MRFLTLLTATLVATLTASAQLPDSGCTDVAACNYDANALTDDGSCFHLSITGTSEICSGETTELTTLLQGSTIATGGWAYADVVETPSMLTVPGEYGTIAAALSASSDGDTILVAPGTYIGTYDLPSSHGVHLISEAGPDVTTLDGNQAESVLAVAGNGFEYTIQGFTITGGYAYQYTTVCNGKMGGGIEICGGAIVTVQDNIVINNLGRHRGGGIRLASDNCIIRRNVIAFNTTPQGWASYDGGAGLCIQASDFIVENNTICYNNESGNYNHGAGVFIGTTGGTFRNNIVYHNTGGDQIYFQSQGTLSVDYSCVTEAISGTGNITALPLFTDGAAGDFSLQATSPCIDAGDPNSPPDSDGSTSDMGAIAILNLAPEPTSYLWDNGTTAPSIQVQPGANQSYSVEVEVDGHQCEATIDVQVEEYACGDPLACNYDDQATCTNITLCTYPGCTDPDACNYDGNAGCDDGNCIHILSSLDTAICEGQPVEFQAIVPESGPNGALNFPNAAQYSGSAFASTGNGASSLNITEDFTIEFWLRVDGMHYWHLMGKNTFGNNSQGWLIKKPGSDLNFAWTYVPNEFNFFAPTPGDWQHVAICFDDASNTFTTFINGTAAYSATKDIQINACSFEYVIGRELGTQNWFQGSIDELHISSVVRHIGNFDPDLTPEADQYSLGLWHFDELSGNIAHDASGHGNHLNLSNTIWETREAGSAPSDFQYAWSDGTSLSSNSFTPESTTSMELAVSGPQFSCAQTAQIVVHPAECDDPLAINYVANAPCGGGECLYAGCTDDTACNYDAAATEDDGSCTYAAYGRDCDGNCGGGTRWFVDATADSAAATGDTLTPFATIQAALDMACPSDTVLIAPGTYVENVSSTVENLTIRGYAPSMPIDEVAANVIIDGNELGTALFISGAGTLLEDVTVQNGKSGYGAGLYLSGAHTSTVNRCTIRDNVGTGDITAHGIQLGANDCVIENCLVTGNYGRKHTINAGGSNNVIRNCRIVDNNAWETGGGIVVYTSGMLIENCLIAGNNNGGVTTYRDDTVIDHCTIVDNTNFGCFIWCYSNDADFYITNTIIANNGNTEFTMVQTGIKVGTAHIRNSIVKGGVDYDWTSVYKVFDVDGSLNTLDPVLLEDRTLASTSSAIGTAGGHRYDHTGSLGTASIIIDLEYAARPQPAGTDADLGAFEHPLGTPEPTFGCTDDTACNYNPAATDDDASCIAPTCDDPTACNYDANATCGGGTCIPSGCMEEDACNYDPAAQCAGEACDYTCCPGPGCCDDPALWDAVLQQCISNLPDTVTILETVTVPLQACGVGTHWDEASQTCVADSVATEVINIVAGIQEFTTLYEQMQALADSQATLISELQQNYSGCCSAVAEVNVGEGDAPNACNNTSSIQYQGHDYDIVAIGDQCWFAENLQTEQYANGDLIDGDLSEDEWYNTESGAQSVMDNDDSNLSDRGRLYNWFAVNDNRGICPSGWHVPSDSEWKTLESELGMPQTEVDSDGSRGSIESPALKSSPSDSPPWNGNNSSGFNAYPGGKRSPVGTYAYGTSDAFIWTSTALDESSAWLRDLDGDSQIERYGYQFKNGFSVRCVKD